jgi:hypothetical protein
MARFCGTCGSPLNETSAFCGACGARVAQAAVAPAATPVPPFSPVPYSPVPQVPPVYPLPPVKTGSSPVLKIVLVVVLLLVVLGTLSVAGMFYAMHLASRKAHEFSRQVRDTALSSLAADDGNAGGSNVPGGVLGPGDCRFLSKEDVGRAIGVAIVATKTTASGCEYLAQGTAGDMTAKHIAAMMASKGATAQQQQMFQSLSHSLLGGEQSQADGSSPPVSTVVMGFTIDPNSAKTQMSANENVLGAVGPGAKPLTGIGDEAFDASGSVMMVRKGDKLIRITYSTCPCTIDAIKPLAQRLASSL